jgi:hypothetical protein
MAESRPSWEKANPIAAPISALDRRLALIKVN